MLEGTPSRSTRSEELQEGDDLKFLKWSIISRIQRYEIVCSACSSFDTVGFSRETELQK